MDKGKQSEQVVSAYLENLGYSVLERNYRCRLGEIDIIAAKDGVLCFVEVKSLTARWDGSEISRMVGPAKMRCIRLTAIDYLNTVDLKGRFERTRFDVAAVTNGCVSYYEGVF